MSRLDFSLSELADLALTVVKEASEMALNPELLPEVKAAGQIAIDTKSNRNDLVTVVDRGIEEYVSRRLLEATGYPLLGEEGHKVDSYTGRVWVLDPIDGTMNYVATHRDYAISLALCEDAKPVVAVVADVVANKFYTAIAGQGAYCNGQKMSVCDPTVPYTEAVLITDLKEILALPRLVEVLKESRGHRRYGSAALECVEVAAKQAGGFVHLWVSPWDIAAALLICQECGVTVTRLDGTPLDIRYQGSILAGWPKVHTGLLNRLVVNAQ